ncbi:hypothetical protein OFL77_27880, partial [Escherichia coli]
CRTDHDRDGEVDDVPAQQEVLETLDHRAFLRSEITTWAPRIGCASRLDREVGRRWARCEALPRRMTSHRGLVPTVLH